MTAALASCWTCARCGVSVSNSDGARLPLPETWGSEAGGEFCLGCRRQRASEGAAEAAPVGSDRATRARLGRAGLIEFEVRRRPERTNASIARACHSSTSAVAAARSRLHLPPAPPPGSDRDWADRHAARPV